MSMEVQIPLTELKKSRIIPITSSSDSPLAAIDREAALDRYRVATGKQGPSLTGFRRVISMKDGTEVVLATLDQIKPTELDSIQGLMDTAYPEIAGYSFLRSAGLQRGYLTAFIPGEQVQAFAALSENMQFAPAWGFDQLATLQSVRWATDPGLSRRGLLSRTLQVLHREGLEEFPGLVIRAVEEGTMDVSGKFLLEGVKTDVTPEALVQAVRQPLVTVFDTLHAGLLPKVLAQAGEMKYKTNQDAQSDPRLQRLLEPFYALSVSDGGGFLSLSGQDAHPEDIVVVTGPDHNDRLSIPTRRDNRRYYEWPGSLETLTGQGPFHEYLSGRFVELGAGTEYIPGTPNLLKVTGLNMGNIQGLVNEGLSMISEALGSSPKVTFDTAIFRGEFVRR